MTGPAAAALAISATSRRTSEGRNGAAVGCPRDRDAPLQHLRHGPLTFAARIGNLTRRHNHRTGHDPEATP